MLFWDILFAIGIALILTAIFAGLLRRRGPWASFLGFFAVVFLAAWAGGVWIRPVGPVLKGVYWLPFLLFGFVVAIILAATAPRRIPERRKSMKEKEAFSKLPAGVRYDSIFLVLIIVLIAVVIIGYFV